MFDQSIPVFTHFLGTLDLLLERAEAFCAETGLDEVEVLEARLADDMLPFLKQVRLTTDFATRGADRLAGRELRSFPDTEISLADLRGRIADTRAYLRGFTPADFDGSATRELTIQTRQAPLTMTGAQFLEFYAKPQLFFHLTTAYGLLRHKGVSLGKLDFMNAQRR